MQPAFCRGLSEQRAQGKAVDGSVPDAEYFLAAVPEKEYSRRMFTLLIQNGDGTAQRHELHQGVTTVGRHPENTIVLDNTSVSSHHAQITVEDGKSILRDLNSANGTTVNGTTVTEVALKAGDSIQFASVDCVCDTQKMAAPQEQSAKGSSSRIPRSLKHAAVLAILGAGIFLLLKSKFSSGAGSSDPAKSASTSSAAAAQSSSVVPVAQTGVVAKGVHETTVALWTNGSWFPIGEQIKGAVSCAVVLDGRVYIGGEFYLSGNADVSKVAVWDGKAWKDIGSNLGSGPGAPISIRAITAFRSTVYIGGEFVINGAEAGIAQWTGTDWKIVGNQIGNTVAPVTLFWPTKTELYVSGDELKDFKNKYIGHLAKWNGEQWREVGPERLDSNLSAMAEDNNALYVAGAQSFITEKGMLSGSLVARIQDGKWSTLRGEQKSSASSIQPYGDEIFFAQSPGLAVWHTKKVEWTALYADSSVDHIVAMGTSLVLSGNFKRIGATEATAIDSPKIAMLTGQRWSAIQGLSGEIDAMAATKDSFVVVGTLKVENK
jgi:hypothetical protein